MQFQRFTPIFAFVALACSSSPERPAKASARPKPEEMTWIQASPNLEREIEQHIAQVPYLQKPDDFLREVDWFVRVGEPAYETLLDVVRDPDPKVAGFALTVFAAKGDARVVPHLASIPWPEGGTQEQNQLRYERARCHVKLGDWEPMSILVEGLDDENLWNRAQCFKALRDETGVTFDYHPRLEGAEREASLVRWRAWLVERNLDPLQKR